MKHPKPDTVIVESAKYKSHINLSMELIREMRNANLTPQKLSILAGLQESTISDIQNGNYVPSLNDLAKIAQAMHKSLRIKFTNIRTDDE